MIVRATATGIDEAPITEAWDVRLGRDARAIEHRLPPELRQLHNVVVFRAHEVGARGLILSGSTARSCRTEISDLDYHLIGPRIVTRDLSPELDLHVLSEAELDAVILSGDDFVQWSLRFGLVVFDGGVLRRAVQFMTEHRPWPDVDRKLRHAAKSVDLARRFVGTGDEDGALEQVRTALSLAARARLLSAGTFPLSRAELPGQLEALGFQEAGEALRATILASVSLETLADAVAHCEELLAVAATAE
jgi:hypothetical protein